MEYTISKEKGNSMYYVCRVGEEKTPLTQRYSKKKALREAARLEGMGVKEYMSVRRKENL